MQPVSSFTALKRRYVTVNVEDGPSYQLRDDVPMEVISQYLDIMATNARYQSRMDALRPTAGTSEEAIFAALEDMKQMLLQVEEDSLAVCVGIWQHTFPERSEEDIAEEIKRHFPLEDRRAIAELFFTLRFNKSSNGSSATTPTTETSGQASTRQPTPSSRKASRAHR